MAIEKREIQVPFGQGLDLKTDPNQVAIGKFLALNNVQFDNGGQLHKRSGFPLLTTLPVTNMTTLGTLNDNLIATGNTLYSYNAVTSSWTDMGTVQPVSLSAKSVVRTSVSQTVCDSASSSYGNTCVAYTDSTGSYYRVVDTETGAVLVAPTALESTAALPKVRLFGNYFLITYIADISGTITLRYVAVPIARPDTPNAAANISTNIRAISSAYDVVVANNFAYFMFDGSDGGRAVRYKLMSASFTLGSETAIATEIADNCTLVADTSISPANIWVVWYRSGTTTIKCRLVDFQLTTVLATTSVNTTDTIVNLTGVSTGLTLSLYYEVSNTYSWSGTTDYISKRTVTSAGTVSSASVILRGVGLASRAFYANDDTTYMLVAYNGTYQPSYFLINSSGAVLARLAYQNGCGYPSSFVLPNVSIVDGTCHVSYLYKAMLVPINKTQGSSLPGVYSQFGVNLASFEINATEQYQAEIAESLHLTGGQLWQFDGVKPVEHGFHVYPENLNVTTSGAGGSITAQQYYYVACYEWTDGAGNLHRSAPSIPTGVVTVGATSTNTIKVPTLRLTAKPSNNPVRIVLYRWSTAQPVYYQVTSITSPTTNSTTTDSVTITDTSADSSILGNVILYTTGGVLENIAAPSFVDICSFKGRLIGIDAENPNQIWYSKQVVQETPVEFSDLQTVYVAPSTGTTAGNAGPCTAVAAMDDKLIFFKRNSLLYMTGNGPDANGANNDFSEPTFITGIVGCTNPKSIVLMPLGLMFQSDKGIWLLGRDLSTKYIGAEVENYNSTPVVSSNAIPGTNQVRFVLSNGTILMYDYYFGQWSTFTGPSPITGCLYQNAHTLLDSSGRVMQQTSDSFVDNGQPVLVSFTTAWIKLVGLQSYQRALYFYLLGTYQSPHRLNVDIAYDYDPTIIQSTQITPLNSTSIYGDDTIYGGSSPYGGGSSVEQFRVFFKRQQCQSVQLTISESFNSEPGLAPGHGLLLSGLNFLIGAKARTPKLPSRQSAG